MDAKTFAEWGIDSFKSGGCNEDAKNFDVLFPKMMRALNSTGKKCLLTVSFYSNTSFLGRKIVFSCEWANFQSKPNYTAISQTCNLFRNYIGMSDSWTSVEQYIDYFASQQSFLVKYNG